MAFVTFPKVATFEDFALAPDAMELFRSQVAPLIELNERKFDLHRGSAAPGGVAPLGASLQRTPASYSLDAPFAGGLIRENALQTAFVARLQESLGRSGDSYVAGQLSGGHAALVAGRDGQPRVRVPAREPIPAFPLGPIVTPVLGDDRNGLGVWILIEDFYFYHEPTTRGFRVRRHFETDGASIPPPLRGLFNSTGRPFAAAIIHDFLYAVGPHGDEPAREDADQVFHDALRVLGVSALDAGAMHTGVRAGGGPAFGRRAEWRFCDPRYNGQRYEQLGYTPVPRIHTAVDYRGPISGYVPRPATPARSPYE